ncbi:helix-turn-helix transcriptional regulator [Sphingomonas sp. 28-62-11]|uniref:S24 family peptidase n=1 Tax=Sphingomonas sp. 28-62-11 TaxID=1970432 RepID=UPI0035A81B1C
MDHARVCANLTDMAARRGESLAALSRLLGRNEAYLQQFVKRGSPRALGERERRILSDYLGMSEHDLGAPDAAGPPSRLVYVPRIDAVASAGPGGVLADDRAIQGEAIDPALLRQWGVRPAELSIITAQGESMLPTIADGDDMLVDRGDQRVGARGGIYVLRLQGVLVVKRLMTRGGSIDVISDNPAFPIITVTPDDAALDVIGRVVRITRLLK